MIPIDISDQHPVVMIAEANQSSSSAAISSVSNNGSKIKVAGICAPIANDPDSEMRYYGDDLELAIKDYFRKFEHREVSGAIEVSLLESPKHGKLDMGKKGFLYYPENNYFGDDRMTYLVKLGSETVKFVIFLKMVPTNTFGNTGEEKACQPKGFMWKISSLPTNTDSTTITYSNLLNDALGAFKGFTDLPAGEVGNTTGEGANAAITLDVNAAGNGWYQSANPFDNSDFLPTADANIWVAKAGSAAAGKMDLLSVLMHEYGHALGLDHSTAATDAMAATLKVGERRLWTEVELAQVTSRYTSLWRSLARE